MSILIKGIDMPEDGKYKIVFIYSDGHVSIPFFEDHLMRVNGIEAVEVPDTDKPRVCTYCGEPCNTTWNFCPCCGAEVDNIP